MKSNPAWSDANDHRSVAIVIPCFRQSSFLAGAIESSLAQLTTADEIIVVDDGGGEDLAKITRCYPGVRLIRQKNGGLPAARNFGLRTAVSNRIVFLDADDQLLPEALHAGLECFDSNPDAAFVYGGYRKIHDSGEIDLFVQVSRHEDLVACNWVGMIGSVMFDRAKLLNLGGFDTSLSMCEDWDVYLRLSRAHVFSSHQAIVARYIRHDANMSNDVSQLLHWINVVRRKELERGLSAQGKRAWRAGRRVWPRMLGIEPLHRRLARRILNLLRKPSV